MRPSASRGCLAEEPAEAGRQSAQQRVHHAVGVARQNHLKAAKEGLVRGLREQKTPS